MEEIKRYKGQENSEVKALGGDIKAAIEMIENTEDKVEAAKLYKDIMVMHPEWYLNQHHIENYKTDRLSADIIKLAKVMHSKII